MRATCIAAVLISGCSFSAVSGGTGDGGIDGPDAVDGPDGDVSSRVTSNLIGLWELAENAGTTITDTSGLAAVNLTIADPAAVVWTAGALTLVQPVDILSAPATNIRLVPPVKATDQITLEAWVTPATTAQRGMGGQPARIVTLTVANIGSHLISLGQLEGTWAGQVLTSAAGLDSHGGTPMLVHGAVTPTLTHLAVTSTPAGRTLYVDGVPVMDDRGGVLDTWKSSYLLAVGGDPGERNTWAGTIHLVAMYDRALAATEIMTNFRAGP